MSADRPSGQRGALLILRPLALLLGVSGIIFGLAKAHPFSRSAPKLAAGASIVTGDPVVGKQVFAKSCAGCHGASAEGGAGPKLDGAAVSLATAQSRIRVGKGVMPGGLLTAQEETDVLGYLKTILANGGVSEALTGDVYRGSIAFTKDCSGCHGTDGAGGAGPRLAGGVLAPDQIRGIVSQGQGAMPAGLASGETLEDILAYLAANVLAKPGGG